MTPIRSYLLKAFYDWICDNAYTPYLLVNATVAGVQVPKQFIEDGKIILNLSPMAIINFKINPHSVSFGTTFSGRHVDIFLPIFSIEAIFAKENNRGMIFDDHEEIEEEEGLHSSANLQDDKKDIAKLHPHLKLVD